MKNRTNSGLILLSFIAFISLGLPDGLLGVAWPGIRSDFSLSLDAMGVYLIVMTIGYTLSSFFNGLFVKKLGIGGLLGVSCMLTGASLFIHTHNILLVCLYYGFFHGRSGSRGNRR